MGSFIKTMEQLQQTAGGKTIFFDARMLTVYWETKPEIIEKILPKCLKPGPVPLVNAFIADYPRTSFCPPYKEAGIFVLAEKDGVLGNYCLDMPITDGMAMAMGREICGQMCIRDRRESAPRLTTLLKCRIPVSLSMHL